MRWNPLPASCFWNLRLTGEGQGLVFHADVDVVLFNLGEVGFEDEFVLGLVDIDGRGPGPVGLGFIEHAGEGVFEDAEIGQGIEMAKGHGV